MKKKLINYSKKGFCVASPDLIFLKEQLIKKDIVYDDWLKERLSKYYVKINDLQINISSDNNIYGIDVLWMAEEYPEEIEAMWNKIIYLDVPFGPEWNQENIKDKLEELKYHGDDSFIVLPDNEQQLLYFISKMKIVKTSSSIFSARDNIKYLDFYLNLIEDQILLEEQNFEKEEKQVN